MNIKKSWSTPKWTAIQDEGQWNTLLIVKHGNINISNSTENEIRGEEEQKEEKKDVCVCVCVYTTYKQCL